MKPFDLEAAKAGEPIICRDGTPAKFIAHVPEVRAEFRVIALVNKSIRIYYETGIHPSASHPHYDLVMAPTKRTVWVNFYFQQSAMYFESQDAANYAHNTFHEDVNRIGGKAYPVEVEE